MAILFERLEIRPKIRHAAIGELSYEYKKIPRHEKYIMASHRQPAGSEYLVILE